MVFTSVLIEAVVFVSEDIKVTAGLAPTAEAVLASRVAVLGLSNPWVLALDVVTLESIVEIGIGEPVSPPSDFSVGILDNA